MLALPRDAHRLAVFVTIHPFLLVYLSTHASATPATSHYLSFPRIPLIAIRSFKYDVGESLYVQLTFKCVR